MMPPRSVWIALILLVANSIAFSEEGERLYRSPSFYGHGHAGMADNTLLDSIYYNPANLAQSEQDQAEYRYLIGIPTIESSKSNFGLFKAKNNGDRINFLKDHEGIPLYLRESQMGIVALGHYAVAFLHDIHASALSFNDIENNATNSVEASLFKTHAASMMTSHTYEQIDWGIGAHLIHREVSSLKASIADVEALKNIKNIKNTTTGSGIGVDFGLRYALVPQQLIFSGAIVNAGNVAIKRRLVAGDTIDTLYQSTDVGLIYQFDWILAQKLYFDFRDIDNRLRSSFFERTHIGYKVDLFDFCNFSWGINQGYWTTAIELAFSQILINFGVYSEEKGKTAGFRQDQRYFLQIIARN